MTRFVTPCSHGNDRSSTSPPNVHMRYIIVGDRGCNCCWNVGAGQWGPFVKTTADLNPPPELIIPNRDRLCEIETYARNYRGAAFPRCQATETLAVKPQVGAKTWSPCELEPSLEPT